MWARCLCSVVSSLKPISCCGTTGARAKAWCLLIHADASLSLSCCGEPDIKASPGYPYSSSISTTSSTRTSPPCTTLAQGHMLKLKPTQATLKEVIKRIVSSVETKQGQPRVNLHRPMCVPGTLCPDTYCAYRVPMMQQSNRGQAAPPHPGVEAHVAAPRVRPAQRHAPAVHLRRRRRVRALQQPRGVARSLHVVGTQVEIESKV